MNFLKRDKTKTAANTGLLTNLGMSKAVIKKLRFVIMPHTWTVSHLVSYLSIVHQVFSTFEAFVELGDPPWCNDLRREKAETVDPATQPNQHKQNGAANLPELQGRGRSMKAQNGSGHCPEKQRFSRCLINAFSSCVNSVILCFCLPAVSGENENN